MPFDRKIWKKEVSDFLYNKNSLKVPKFVTEMNKNNAI